MFWNYSLPAKSKSSTCIIITTIRELFSCHVNTDGSISGTFPPFAKAILLFYDTIFNDASESPYTHYLSSLAKLIPQFASTGFQ